MMSDIVVIAHNIRSAHNIGSILRSADCFGVSRVIMSGYSPYPSIDNDPRLPHIAQKLTEQIHKTALGAEHSVPCSYQAMPLLEDLRQQGYHIVALEQSPTAVELSSYKPHTKVALLLGEERYGIDKDLLLLCDDIVEIKQYGKKESLNVSVATGICLYQLRQTEYTIG